MGLRGNRSIGHRAGREALDDRRCRFDLIDRNSGTCTRPEAEQAADGHEAGRLVVDARAVFTEDVEALVPCRVLQAEHRLRVEQVRLALAPPLVLAAHVQGAVGRGDARRRVCHGMPCRDLCSEDIEADSAELRGGPGEVGLNERLREADRLEDLGAAIRGNRRDTHLRHDLEQALAERLDEVAHRTLRGGARYCTAAREVLDGLEGKVRVHRSRAVSDEQRHMVHLAHVAGLDEHRDHRAGLRPDEVVMHCSAQEE
ncbi:unannotated protein [freshwater metagenome]|uniref:Unannotated protein n=1 Tax=freshwater metagenome TaxID=449393 RepID=A0A6J7IXJ6_9ZZZZ